MMRVVEKFCPIDANGTRSCVDAVIGVIVKTGVLYRDPQSRVIALDAVGVAVEFTLSQGETPY